MSSNKSDHPSNSSSKMDESVGRISEVEDEIDDEDKDKEGDEEKKDEHEEDNGEDEKEDETAPSPSPSQLGQDLLPSLTPSERTSAPILYALLFLLSAVIERGAYRLAMPEARGGFRLGAGRKDTANAHCTIISRVVEETRKQLGVAHFNQEEAERSKKVKGRAAKDAQKAMDEAVHAVREAPVVLQMQGRPHHSRWGAATVNHWDGQGTHH
ncbi:hypothetical protein SERLA73DRAFT_149066 [Serpula lacrymans var. lacrymans S7.3]|uniref:Uncharacterized protein n=2 Tax=Serpula lacrymans var. lacrymans TaxID=341189 RepID=F8PI63_SERL3|nr:uncharacterized protein SERLADRAFT_404642 [Serpula lacrymans var. lacrymans S7.9]EGO04641.1 hypothetical protein SERLA73DRAFT_149066 [Serpula lacrymans var. lacrymans S7.3]EGO30500.1 hypothetical protein SERLADRAFT_404642 [Serpula lacrymans var. lacrymans S7.9]